MEGETERKKRRKTGEPTIFIAFVEMLLKEQNEMDLIKHHLFSVTVYLCDCVYIHNKWFKRVLVHTIRIREIMCVSLGV